MPSVPRTTLAEAKLKYLLIGTALVAVGLGVAWYGGETWLSNKARAALASSPVVEVASVAPLRDPARIGMRLTTVEIGDAQNGLSAPEVDVFARLTSPLKMTVSLPPQLDLRVDAVPVALTLAQGQAYAAIAPTHEMGIGGAGVTVQDVGIDGVQLLELLDVDAQLTHIGGAAPQGSRASYDVSINWQALAIGNLTEGLDVTGPVQLWLTELPGQPMLEGRVPPPALTGAQTQGLRFSLGEIEATLIGRIQADANGFAEGEAAFYTGDGRRFVDAAVKAGLVPQKAAMLVGAVIDKLAATPIPGEIKAAEEKAEAKVEELLPEADPDLLSEADMTVSLPPAQKGQIRLPVILKDGKIHLGPVPIGPAPRLIAG